MVKRLARPCLVVGVITLVVVGVLASGVVDRVRDDEQLRASIDNAGALGPLVFVGLMVLLVPLNVPGVLFVVPATVLFGTVGGVALSLVGGFLASAVGVLAARRLGRAVFETRMPERVRRIEARVSANGFWAVVVLRMFTYLMQPVDWLCGISSIPTRTVLAGTFVGLIPPTLVVSLGGGGLLGRVL